MKTCLKKIRGFTAYHIPLEDLLNKGLIGIVTKGTEIHNTQQNSRGQNFPLYTCKILHKYITQVRIIKITNLHTRSVSQN